MESNFEGLPCRHELCLYIKESLPVSVLNIHKRWTLKYFDPSVLCPIEEESEREDEIYEEEQNQDVVEQTQHPQRSTGRTKSITQRRKSEIPIQSKGEGARKTSQPPQKASVMIIIFKSYFLGKKSCKKARSRKTKDCQKKTCI